MDGAYEDKRALMAALRRGDEAAFAWVFRAYYGQLVNYASRLLRDGEEANDVTQETFCRLFERRGELHDGIDLRPYLYKSVYNGCMNVLKHREVEREYADKELEDFYFSRVVETPEAELALRDEELRGALDAAIGALPERCREVFVLSKVEGLSNKEIAERLDISPKTVENQMTTALARLRKELEWLLALLVIAGN